MSTIESLQQELNELKQEVQSLKSLGAKPVKEKKPRAPSAFNVYMKSAIAEIKTAEPGITHSDAFKKAASDWKDKKGSFVAE